MRLIRAQRSSRTPTLFTIFEMTMNSSIARPHSYTGSILAALVSTGLLMGVPNAATAQRTTTDAALRSAKGLSGQMLPLQPLPAGMEPAVSAVMARIRMSVCKPSQPSGGPGPSSFIQVLGWPSGLEFEWPAVPGAVAYLVERAVDDGTAQWSVVGSTCGSPDALREYQYNPVERRIRFSDIAGGIQAGAAYVYKVSAVGASGEVGWNSVRWSSPPSVPLYITTTITGSTVELATGLSCGISGISNPFSAAYARGMEVAITASYGLSRAVPVTQFCGPFTISPVVVYGVPEGTHTFTVSAFWTQEWDPSLPRVVGTSSASTTVTIKP